MLKGNSGLPCPTAPPCTMGFFVIITQRPNIPVLSTLCPRANGSVRPVSSVCALLAPRLPRCASCLLSMASSNTPESLHSASRSYGCLPPSSPSTVVAPPGRFSPTGFIPNASHTTGFKSRDSRPASEIKPIQSIQFQC
jgi:hypothetical protein